MAIENFDKFSRWNIESVRNMQTFKIRIYSIMTNKKIVMHWGKFKYFKLQKISLKKLFACKSYLKKKDL